MKRIMFNTRRLTVFAPAIACLLLAACGDDKEDAATATSVEIIAANYSFTNVPTSVAAGSTLSLRNSSTDELHEMVVFRIPDNETRSVADLLALPEDEQNAIFGDGPPAIVQLAMPGSADFIPAVGDGTLTEPGRYAMVCFIPQGVDPQAYMDAAETSGDGPPDVAGGLPHVALGMYAELTVNG